MSAEPTADNARYDQVIAWLWSRINFERVGVPRGLREVKLDRIRQVLDRLGNPEARLKIVHVAGTKGKGSTCTLIASILQAASYKVGLYTSPHLERFEERIAVNGAACSPADVVRLVERLRPVAEEVDSLCGGSERGPTFFDIVTAMGFLHFAEQEVDYAVIEVGLGGRLDSTNACTPVVCAITSIGMDHMKQLGNTLVAIASEKSGIIKPGIPVVSGVTGRGPQSVIAVKADEVGARLIQLGSQEAPHPALRDLALTLRGNHQRSNATVALAVIDQLRDQGATITEQALRTGLTTAKIPARIELIPGEPAVIIDAAHNDTSAAALAATLAADFFNSERTLILAISRDKDAGAVVEALRGSFERFIITNFVNNPRALAAAELAEIVAHVGVPRERIHTAPDPTSAWRLAQEITPSDGMIVVTGSFFLAAELRPLILREHGA